MSDLKINDILVKTPYNEEGQELSFRTLAETVVIDGQNLKDYLNSLKSLITEIGSKTGTNGKDGAAGKDGASFSLDEVKYASVSDEENNLNSVRGLPESRWSFEMPNLQKITPHLWKRTLIVETNNGVNNLKYEYQYCGSLGTPGADGEWREWIFKIDGSSNVTKIQLTLELANCVDDYVNGKHFEDNDFVPSGWEDDIPTLNDLNKVIWCATRDKIAGVWQDFTNLHIYGSKSEYQLNNIYAALDANTYGDIYELNSTKWELDKTLLVGNILFKEGEIISFPDSLNYPWKDDVEHDSDTKIVFLATCYFINHACVSIDNPIRITGPQGLGSDGNGVEFAYISKATLNELVDPPIGTPAPITSSNSGGWCDNAANCSISGDTPYQFMSSRKGVYINDNNWFWEYDGNYYGKNSGEITKLLIDADLAPAGWNYGWSDPVLWSSWGQDGIDGDGVLYVFLRLNKKEYEWVTKYGWNMENTQVSTGTGGSGSNDPDSGGSESGGESGGEEETKVTYDLVIPAVYIAFNKTKALVTIKVKNKATNAIVTTLGLQEYICPSMNLTSSTKDNRLGVYTVEYGGQTLSKEVHVYQYACEYNNTFLVYKGSENNLVLLGLFTVNDMTDGEYVATYRKDSNISLIIAPKNIEDVTYDIYKDGTVDTDNWTKDVGTDKEIFIAYTPKNYDSNAVYKVILKSTNALPEVTPTDPEPEVTPTDPSTDESKSYYILDTGYQLSSRTATTEFNGGIQSIKVASNLTYEIQYFDESAGTSGSWEDVPEISWKQETNGNYIVISPLASYTVEDKLRIIITDPNYSSGSSSGSSSESSGSSSSGGSSSETTEPEEEYLTYYIGGTSYRMPASSTLVSKEFTGSATIKIPKELTYTLQIWSDFDADYGEMSDYGWEVSLDATYTIITFNSDVYTSDDKFKLTLSK